MNDIALQRRRLRIINNITRGGLGKDQGHATRHANAGRDLLRFQAGVTSTASPRSQGINDKNL